MIRDMGYLNLSLDERLEDLPRGVARDEAMQALAGEAASNKDIATVSRILQEMENPGIRLRTAENLAKQMLQGLDLEAFEYLDESFEVSANREIETMANAVRLSKARDIDGINHLLEEAPSSKVALMIKETLVKSLAPHDLESTLSWLNDAGTVGLEDASPLISFAISQAKSDNGDRKAIFETIANGFPELLPHTYHLISEVHDIETAESIFALLPADHKEPVMRRWMSSYESHLTPAQAARIKSRFENEPQQ